MAMETPVKPTVPLMARVSDPAPMLMDVPEILPKPPRFALPARSLASRMSFPSPALISPTVKLPSILMVSPPAPPGGACKCGVTRKGRSQRLHWRRRRELSLLESSAAIVSLPAAALTVERVAPPVRIWTTSALADPSKRELAEFSLVIAIGRG